MDRNITKTDRKATAQWRAAWSFLSAEERTRIAAFCVAADTHVASVTLKGEM